MSLADIVWVAASVVVVGSGALSTLGSWLAVIVAVAVADFAAFQLWQRREMGAGPLR